MIFCVPLAKFQQAVCVYKFIPVFIPLMSLFQFPESHYRVIS